MKYIVDRIEEDRAVLEDENGDFITVSTGSLPPEIREGGCLKTEAGLLVSDEARERERRHKLFLLQQKLKQTEKKPQ